MKRAILLKVVLAFLIFICLSRFIYAQDDKDSASGYLSEYAISLYKKGDVLGAIEQLQKALLVNPESSLAWSYLNKISEEQQPRKLKTASPAQKSEVDESKNKVGKPEQDSRSYQEQELQLQKEMLGEEKRALSVALKDSESKIEELKEQLIQLQEESRSYQEQFQSLKERSEKKYDKLLQVKVQLEYDKKNCQQELAKVKTGERSARADYQKRIKSMETALAQKDKEIEKLSGESEQISKERKKMQDQRLTEIDKLIGITESE